MKQICLLLSLFSTLDVAIRFLTVMADIWPILPISDRFGARNFDKQK